MVKTVFGKSTLFKLLLGEEKYQGKIISSDEEIYGKGAKRTLPAQEVINSYIAEIAESIALMKPLMEEKLSEVDSSSPPDVPYWIKIKR